MQKYDRIKLKFDISSSPVDAFYNRQLQEYQQINPLQFFPFQQSIIQAQKQIRQKKNLKNNNKYIKLSIETKTLIFNLYSKGKTIQQLVLMFQLPKFNIKRWALSDPRIKPYQKRISNYKTQEIMLKQINVMLQKNIGITKSFIKRRARKLNHETKSGWFKMFMKRHDLYMTQKGLINRQSQDHIKEHITDPQ